jgi:hypothetical protein
MNREVCELSAEKTDHDRYEIGGTELNLDQLEAVSGGDQKQSLLATTLSNIASLWHDVQQTAANNLRA